MRKVFWTNHSSLLDATIAELYRQRWQSELFLRWVKQSLRIRTFFGTNHNAVRVQLWSAICIYLATEIARTEFGLITNLTNPVQVLSVHALFKVHLPDLLAKRGIGETPLDTAE